MSAYSCCENNPKELFEELCNNFSAENVRSFLKSIWLGQSLSISYEGALSKEIYLYGDQDEVYTAKERVFIETAQNIIVFSSFIKRFHDRDVKCRIVAANMNWSSDPVWDSINFMKIFHKAMHDFNIFVFTAIDSVYLGCDLLGNGEDDCYISLPLNDAMDWDSFSESMMYASEDSFYSFYHNLIGTVTSIKHYYTRIESVTQREHYELDFDCLQGQSILRGRDYAVEEYEAEVSYCKRALSYIRANVVNSLELLYEAESAEKHATNEDETLITQGELYIDDQQASDKQNERMMELLDDPEALIYALKKKRERDGDGSLP